MTRNQRGLIAIGILLFMTLLAALLQESVRHAKAQEQPAALTKHEKLLRDFQKIKTLLRQKNVPFDPEILLQPNWESKLLPVLEQIPEMQVSRVVGDKIEGVQMADTLYLPEKVKFTSDTIILAKKVIFEGRNAVLKGHHNIYFMPIEMEGVLGTSLTAAMRRQMGYHFVNASFSSPTTLAKFRPELLNKDWSLTIDTSGYGYKDWLEDQKKKPSEGLVSEASIEAESFSTVKGGQTHRRLPGTT